MRKFTPLAAVAVILLTGITTLLLVNACRKTDSRDENLSGVANGHSLFFRMPAGTNPIVIAIAQNIKRQDLQRNFVSGLSKKAGYPVWNKAIIAKATTPGARLQKDSGEVILIPFVRENENVTNAVLLANTTASRDTTFKLVYASRYEDYGFDYSDTTKAGARNIFHLFTLFDNEIFGYEQFTLKDRRILSGDLRDSIGSTTVTLTDGFGKGYINRMVTSITFCNSYEVCNVCGFRIGGRTESTPCHCGSHLEEICTTVWVDVGSGGGDIGGGWNEGGGEGGGGGNWDDENPCRLMPGDTTNACGGGNGNGGWEPVDNSPIGVENFFTWEVSDEDQLAINNWRNYNIDTTGLNICIREMLEKLLWNNDLMGKMLVKMDRAIFEPTNLEKFHINFKSRVMGLDTAGATLNANYNVSTGYFSADVVLNTKWIDSSTQLGTAHTLMHEITHAYLKSIFYRYYYTLNPTLIQNMNYDSLFSAYADTLLVRHSRNDLNAFITGNPQFDHNFMADQFLDVFAKVLEFMDDDRIANKRYYWFISWGGLYKTKTWKYHWPNYPALPPSNPSPSEDSTRGLKYALTLSRIDSLSDAIDAEEKGTSSALGRPKIPGACY